jgi:DDE superfamily endonuclease
VEGSGGQVIADPAGRLIWVSAALPGADMGAAREHGIIDAVNDAGIPVLADTAYQGGGPAIRVPFRRRRLDLGTGRYRPLSANQKAVNTAHARRRGPGERANAEIKNWKVLRKIRTSPQPGDHTCQRRPNADHRRLRSGWKRLNAPRPE